MTDFTFWMSGFSDGGGIQSYTADMNPGQHAIIDEFESTIEDAGSQIDGEYYLADDALAEVNGIMTDFYFDPVSDSIEQYYNDLEGEQQDMFTDVAEDALDSEGGFLADLLGLFF